MRARLALVWTALALPSTSASQTIDAAVAAFSSRPAVEAQAAKDTLPAGFVMRQMATGILGGFTGSLTGLLTGIVVVLTDTDHRGGDALTWVGGGFVLGYVIGAPIAVHAYSRSKGVPSPILAPFAGSVVGTLGAALGGVGFFVTVPLGAATGYNMARADKRQDPPSR